MLYIHCCGNIKFIGNTSFPERPAAGVAGVLGAAGGHPAVPGLQPDRHPGGLHHLAPPTQLLLLRQARHHPRQVHAAGLHELQVQYHIKKKRKKVNFCRKFVTIVFIFCPYSELFTDKKENIIFLMYKEIQRDRVQIHIMTNGLLIYGEIFAHFLIHIHIRTPFLIYDFTLDLI
jgi:hypothetical protein